MASGSGSTSSAGTARLLDICKTQINFLLSTLDSHSLERNTAEIRSLIDQHGHEIGLHLFKRALVVAAPLLATGANSLLGGVGGGSGSGATPGSTSGNQEIVVQLMVTEVKRCVQDIDVATRFRDAIDLQEFGTSAFNLTKFLEWAKLDQECTAVLLAVLGTAATRTDVRTTARRILESVLPLFISNLVSEGNYQEMTSARLTLFLTYLISIPAEGSLLFSHQKGLVVEAIAERCSEEEARRVFVESGRMANIPDAASLAQEAPFLAPILVSSPNALEAVSLKKGADQEHYRVSPLNIAECILVFASMSEWQGYAANLVKTVTRLAPAFAWAEVVQTIASTNRSIRTDGRESNEILEAIVAMPRGTTHPIATLWSTWSNPQLQLVIFSDIVTKNPQSLASLDSGFERLFAPSHFSSGPVELQTLLTDSGLVNSAVNNFELLKTLSSIINDDKAEGIVRDVAMAILERAAKLSPESVAVGLAKMTQPWTELHKKWLSSLLKAFFEQQPNHQLVFHRLWQENPKLLRSMMEDAYRENPMNVVRVLEILQQTNAVQVVYEADLSLTFALDLAALASRRDVLDFQAWLRKRFAASEGSDRARFTQDLLDFLDARIKAEATRLRSEDEPQTNVDLNPQTIAILLRFLNGQNLRDDEQEYLKTVKDACFQVHPRLMNFHGGDESQLEVTNWTQEIEVECLDYYRRLYEDELTVEQLLRKIQTAKESKTARDHEVFSFMIFSLFDEYRFYNGYPAKQLDMTGNLLGSLIQYRLVVGTPLRIAIRYILDALRSPPDHNMFSFGLQALSCFQGRVKEWAQLGAALLQIPHLQSERPQMYERIRQDLDKAAEQKIPQDASITTDGSGQGASVQSKPAFTALQIDTLLQTGQDQFEIPDEKTSDRILFIVNNLTMANVESKSQDMKAKLDPSYYRWFANYLVLQRASIEPNYHKLYTEFLRSLDAPDLDRAVLAETYAKIGILLLSEKTVQSSTERTLLKNLGSWLGGLTLAVNKPIKHRSINLKGLLLEGYENERLIVAIPFVCKVLEQCAKSRVFVQPNPWLMGIIRLLLELYHAADLKLNLKFEIEVLCKSLQIDQSEIESSDILKNIALRSEALQMAATQQQLAQQQQQQQQQQQRQDQQQQLQQQHSAVEAASTSNNVKASDSSPVGATYPATSSPLNYEDRSLLSDADINVLLGELVPHLTFNTNLAPILASSPGIKRNIHLALERAVREIVAPVVERSVHIGSLSTRELVLKDFAMEVEEDRVRRAAHLAAATLAGSLALVTCKEPLRISMTNHIRTVLLNEGFSELSLPESQIQAIVSDNLEAACSVIEKAAMDKAIPDIEAGLSGAYLIRRTHKSSGDRASFWDSTVLPNTRFLSNLPDPLRIKPHGLTERQLQVYEDFAPDNRMMSYATAEPAITAAKESRASHTPGVPGVLSEDQSLEQFYQHLAELEAVLSSGAVTSLNVALANQEIRQALRTIPYLTARSSNVDETALAFSQKVVQMLYKNDQAISREVYVLLLQRICEVSGRTRREVSAWLTYADDDRKLNVPVTITLISVGLIVAPELDSRLAKIIDRDGREGRLQVIEFTANLIKEYISGQAIAADVQDFAGSMEALSNLPAAFRELAAVTSLMDQLGSDKLKGSQSQAIKEQMAAFFGEWVELYKSRPASEKAFVSFLMQLEKQGVFAQEETTTLFFRVSVEVGINTYMKQVQLGRSAASGAFLSLDAFAKLLVLLVKYNAEPQKEASVGKVTYMQKILSIIVLILAHQHEEYGAEFPQKAFFRLFSSILNELHSIQSNLGSAYFKLLIALASSFGTLSPLQFPGFTFSWMALISHRLFMPRLLERDGWPMFHSLLTSLMQFLAPLLRQSELSEPRKMLYKGFMRILLVILHDFPEFHVEYFSTFCSIMPETCIQARNLVLSAFPRTMRLPDPFLRSLKLDRIPEIYYPPPVASDFQFELGPELKDQLEHYLEHGESLQLPAKIKSLLSSSTVGDGKKVNGDTDTHYNVPLMNALVLTIGVHGSKDIASLVNAVNGTDRDSRNILGAPGRTDIELLEYLLHELEPEGKYHLLSSIANQLRYPNAHTWYFSSALLLFFSSPDFEGQIKEQITRVLLERLIVNRPHPWGLLITFVELIKDPKYQFWSYEFTRATPVIEGLFQSISRSIAQ